MRKMKFFFKNFEKISYRAEKSGKRKVNENMKDDWRRGKERRGRGIEFNVFILYQFLI